MRNSLQYSFVAISRLIRWRRCMLSACTVGPNYHRPVVQTPAAFHAPDESQQTARKPNRSPICRGGRCSTTLNCRN